MRVVPAQQVLQSCLQQELYTPFVVLAFMHLEYDLCDEQTRGCANPQEDEASCILSTVLNLL